VSPLSEPTGPFAAEARWKIVLAGALIVLAGVAAYHNSLAGPFVFDDPLSIGENLTLRPPWSLAALLSPPADATVGGRPLVNVTLAVNYALGGTEVWSYHALNLVIHILASLALFGVVRRTLLHLGSKGQGARGKGPMARSLIAQRSSPACLLPAPCSLLLPDEGTFLAFIIALLWTLHPLQTEAVTYIVQRTESLMGLFYLLTLYGFIRGAAGDETIGTPPWYRRAWYGFSFGACLLGMACKEVMVSAPVMVLLYDRTFLAESFAEAWQRRWRVHLSLAATWILLGVLVASIGANRGGTTGIGSGASPGAYWLTQFPAVMEYLWLSLWPYPLVFDYGAEWVRHAVDVVPAALIVILLAAGTLVALKRRPILGFLGAWFFAILGPSSLVPGPRQTMAEHRMYLALAAVLTLVVVGGWARAGRRTLVAWLALALGFGGLTAARNEVYRTELSLWRDTVARRPGNRWAQCNVGMALYEQGRVAEALPHFERGLKLGPDDPAAHNDLGLALAKLGRLPEAVAQYEAALQLEPAFAEAHNNLGLALSELNRPVEGLEHLRTALRLRPGLATVHFNLGNTLAQLGRLDEAVAHFLEAIRSNPNDAAACTNLGNVLARAGRIAEAIRWYETAARLDPGDALAQYNLAMMLAQVGRTSEAIEHFQEVLRLRPDDAEAREYLMRLQAVLRPGGTR